MIYLILAATAFFAGVAIGARSETRRAKADRRAWKEREETLMASCFSLEVEIQQLQLQNARLREQHEAKTSRHRGPSVRRFMEDR